MSHNTGSPEKKKFKQRSLNSFFSPVTSPPDAPVTSPPVTLSPDTSLSATPQSPSHPFLGVNSVNQTVNDNEVIYHQHLISRRQLCFLLGIFLKRHANEVVKQRGLRSGHGYTMTKNMTMSCASVVLRRKSDS